MLSINVGHATKIDVYIYCSNLVYKTFKIIMQEILRLHSIFMNTLFKQHRKDFFITYPTHFNNNGNGIENNMHHAFKFGCHVHVSQIPVTYKIDDMYSNLSFCILYANKSINFQSSCLWL